MNKYIMELIGTFFLVLTIGLTDHWGWRWSYPSSGDWLGSYGNGLCGRPHFGRPLQSCRNIGGMDSWAM